MTGTPDANTVFLGEDPPAADLQAMMREMPLPSIVPGIVDPATMCSGQATDQALAMLKALNAALASHDAKALGRCFFPGQTYWKDSLALTWRLCTFTSLRMITASLLQTKSLRRLHGAIKLEGTPHFVPATPVLVGHWQRRTPERKLIAHTHSNSSTATCFSRRDRRLPHAMGGCFCCLSKPTAQSHGRYGS